jgi:hypothetical protein
MCLADGDFQEGWVHSGGGWRACYLPTPTFPTSSNQEKPHSHSQSPACIILSLTLVPGPLPLLLVWHLSNLGPEVCPQLDTVVVCVH